MVNFQDSLKNVLFNFPSLGRDRNHQKIGLFKMDRPENLAESADLVKILVQLDDQSFNLLVDYLKNLKELNDYGQLGRFLRLRRIDPTGVSKELVILINSSPPVKQHFIQALFANLSESIHPEAFLAKGNDLEAKNKTSSNDQPILKSPRLEPSNQVRNPIPNFRDQLIQSTRSNFLPSKQLIQKFSVLNSEEIGDIWLQLTQSELLLPQFYQELLDLLITNKDVAISTFLIQIDPNERSLRKMAELLWNRGINIYSPEESSNLEKVPNNLEPLNYSTSPFPLEFLDSSNQETSSKTTNIIYHDKSSDNLVRSNGIRKTDSSILQSWIILKKNLTPPDREMIGNWIGLSEDQILYLKENVSSVSSFLPDKLHIVRAIDALKTKYNRPEWLVDLARTIKIRLGYPGVSTESNSVKVPYKLPPIKIDF